MSDDIDADADSWWTDQVEVFLADGPLKGQTVTAPARTLPPHHLLIHPGTPPRVRAGTNMLADPSGWLLYGYSGTTGRDRVQQFTFRRPADQPEDR